MFLWFAAGAAAIVWVIFNSPMIDYRVVMLGAVLPVVEVPWGVGALHTLLASVAALTVVMLATTPKGLPRRRSIRRRWLGLPIGMFLHLILDGVWTDARLFWWPFAGGLPGGLFGERAPELGRGVWTVAMEAAGGLLLVWLWGRWGLDDPDRRRTFLRTGQLDRAVAMRTPPPS